MPIQHKFKCAQCGMLFPNDDGLLKHKTRFCVGVKDSGIGRKSNYSDDEQTNRYGRSNYPSDPLSTRRSFKYQSQIDKKRDEVNEWKHKRSMLQEIKDIEDRIFNDSHKSRKLANNLKKQNDEYNQVLFEYERLQAEERELLREMFNMQGPFESPLYHSNGLTSRERSQLEYLQQENARLEQERRIIQMKLKKLILDNDQLTTLPNYEPHKLLRNMEEQRDRSEKTLQRLLIHPDDRRAVSVDAPSLPYLRPQRRTSDGDDIRNLRNAYLQSGGHNAAVLASYGDVERKLTRYEYYPWMKDRPEPLRRQRYYAIPAMPSIENTPNKLTFAKNDHHRLQGELEDMRHRFQGLDSRTKKLELSLSSSRGSEPISNDNYSYSSSKVNGYPPLNSLIHPSTRQNDHLRRTNGSVSPTMDRHITFSPYNPLDGFVIYFDFIVNLSSSIDQIRLISCLHHEQTGLGEPSKLDSCKCEFSTDESTNELMRIAFVATKQPVPRCPAQQALKIIIEAQVTLKQTPLEPFSTAAWSKMPIFDHKNRLLAGRWKIPLKALPIHHDERLSVISRLPGFGQAELYYRLVNLREASDQSNAALLPKTKDLYMYPPQDSYYD